MAIIPKESIFDHSDVKPFTFALWCLLCEVKHSKFDDVFLDIKKAAEANIKKSAYYKGFSELEEAGWIELSKIVDGKKYWKLIKGFSQKINSTNMEVSTNAESEFHECGNYEGDISTNVENISTNAESHIRNTFFNENLTREERDLTHTQDAPAREAKTEDCVRDKTSPSFFENSFSQNPKTENPKKELHFLTEQILIGIRARLKIEKLPPNHAWFELCQFAFANKFTAEKVLLCYDTLERQRLLPDFWRRGRITARTVIENLPILDSLVSETNKFEREVKNGRLQNAGRADAGTRNSERIRNTNDFINELRRQGELEREAANRQALSG